MNWIATLHNLYWFTDRTGIGASERVLRSRQILEMLELELAHREGVRGGRPGYRGEVDHYHASLVASFARALDSDAAPPYAASPYAASPDAAYPDAASPTAASPHAAFPDAAFPTPASSGIAERRAEAVTRKARRAMLDHVILPYNATVGQPRLDDRLDGLVESGARVFAEALEASLPELDPAARDRALAVFHAWGNGIEGIRAELGRWTRDSRVQWLPLALVLHPSEHDSRAEVDALVEHAVGRAFTGGNELEYLDQNRFQSELVRSIREARRMHLLWIHDFRARRDDGDADRAGFEIVTNGYLPALIESVRRHDLGEPIPTFVILLDQYYYEENRGRTWMTLLERPLEGTPRLPGGPGSGVMEARVAELQEELRFAVAASDRLAAAEQEHGPGWIERLVRVQVNITQPSDFSFRSESVLAFPVGADNLMRDHRKIMARDLDPADPWRGEVIVTGMGVGDHYADPGWDDRSLRVRGPGALPVLDEARAVLEAHGIKGEAIPEVLRRGSSPVAPDRPDGPVGPGDPPADRAEPPGARVLQLHNRTGLDAKEASFVQMLLYDLLPAGTVIYVPDSLWTSPEWMAQLVSAALRGCEVLIVAPALAHAPQPGFPSMSETRELLTALLVVEETLGRVVREAGGRIQVGVYARSTSTTDERGRVTELRHALLRDPGARTFVDLSLVEPTGSPSTPSSTHPSTPSSTHPSTPSSTPSSTRTDSADARHPLLHGKTQLYAARELLDRLARAPELAPTLRAFEEGRISEDEASQAVAALATATGSPELYLLVGSLNRNVRSMALDGEVVVIVSGAGATVGLLDFLLLSGAVRWLETPEELDALIPPVPEWKRLLGRWLLRII